MRVFVFGAGVSYGAHQPIGNLTPDYVPPLVDQLFDGPYERFFQELRHEIKSMSADKELQKLARWKSG